MATDLDEFLEHAGVKGMKWGVRKADSSSSSSPTRRPLPKASPNTKYLAKELSFGSIAPAAMIMGLGPPLSIALGISVGVLRSPPVANAIRTTAAAQRDLLKEFGDTKLAIMRESKESQTKLKVAAAGLGTTAAATTVAVLQNAN